MNVDFNHIDDQDVSSDGLTSPQWDANAQCNASAMAMEPQHQATEVKFREKNFVCFGFFGQGIPLPAPGKHSGPQISILHDDDYSDFMLAYI